MTLKKINKDTSEKTLYSLPLILPIKPSRPTNLTSFRLFIIHSFLFFLSLNPLFHSTIRPLLPRLLYQLAFTSFYIHLIYLSVTFCALQVSVSDSNMRLSTLAMIIPFLYHLSFNSNFNFALRFSLLPYWFPLVLSYYYGFTKSVSRKLFEPRLELTLFHLIWYYLFLLCTSLCPYISLICEASLISSFPSTICHQSFIPFIYSTVLTDFVYFYCIHCIFISRFSEMHHIVSEQIIVCLFITAEALRLISTYLDR